MDSQELSRILEALLLAADQPLPLKRLLELFNGGDNGSVTKEQVMEALERLRESYQSRGVELAEVASGFRLQVRSEMEPWVSRLWEEKPPRYSRALLETLAIIAYRQPITRADIEDIRGVSVSSQIVKTLMEREWIQIVGHRDLPGRPAMFGTTRRFLDYFNLKSLDELPTLAELRDLDKLNPELGLEQPQAAAQDADSEPGPAAGAEVQVDREADADETDGPAASGAAEPGQAEATDDSVTDAPATDGDRDPSDDDGEPPVLH